MVKIYYFISACLLLFSCNNCNTQVSSFDDTTATISSIKRDTIVNKDTIAPIQAPKEETDEATLISNAQEHCDFDSFIKNEFPAKEKDFMEGKLNLKNINIGFIFFKPIRYLGFIDSKIKRRIDVKFLKISKSEINDSIYLAKGKTIVGKNTRLFEGKIQIRQIYFFKYISTGLEGEMDGIVKSQGIIIADYHFREDKKLSATGVFEGKVLLRWYVNNKGVFSYDTINNFSDDYNNNQFIGTWTSYKTGVKKVANWGAHRIPCSGDLDIGAAEFMPNEKYYKYGWEDYKP